MAVVKFNKKPQINGVANIKVTDSPDGKLLIRYTGFTGELGNILVDKNFRLRIEAKDCDILQAMIDNWAIVIGDVQYAKVVNSLNVEGSVINYQCPRGTISVDKNIKVTYGPELQARRQAEYGYTTDKQTVKVLKIDGKLMNLIVDAHNIEIETVILGNINDITVGNVLDVKGTVKNAKVDNIIKATMGCSKAKSTKELQRQAKKRAESINKVLNPLFNGK